MSALAGLENKLAEVNKGLPQLPQNWKNWIAQYAWVFALIGGILGAILSLMLLMGSILVSSVATTTVGLYGDAAVVNEVHKSVIFLWLSLAVLVAYTIVLFISVPKLKAMKKAGWDLSFYSAVFFLVYDVVSMFQSFNVGSIIGLIWNLVWAALGFYILFQIREKFLGAKAAAAPKAPVA